MNGLNKNAFFPVIFSLALGSFFSCLGLFLKRGQFFRIFISLLFLFFIRFSWADSFFTDSEFDNKYMTDSLVMGMFFFLIREALLFVRFFWGWFDHKWRVNIQINNLFSPSGVSPILPLTFSIPILNTALLVIGGFWLRRFHASVLGKERLSSLFKVFSTLSLTFFFLVCQLVEYKFRSFRISRRVYGSLFFLLTGFHGAHVTLRAFLIFFCLLFFFFFGTRQKIHPLFKFSAFYYHFVDIVWLFLVLLVYFSNYYITLLKLFWSVPSLWF